jgi:hypothetical protein
MLTGCVVLLTAIFLYLGYMMDKRSSSTDSIIGWVAYACLWILFFANEIFCESSATFRWFAFVLSVLGLRYYFLEQEVKNFEKYHEETD